MDCLNIYDLLFVFLYLCRNLEELREELDYKLMMFVIYWKLIDCIL